MKLDEMRSGDEDEEWRNEPRKIRAPEMEMQKMK